MLFFHVEIFSTLRSISFFCCNLTENCCSIHIAFTEMNVERYNFLKGLHLQLEHLQHHQNHTLFVGTKNHFELHWYSPQIFNFMLCFPNFFWKLKKPSSEQTWFAGTKIVILSCLLQIAKFSISSCFFTKSFETDEDLTEWGLNVKLKYLQHHQNQTWFARTKTNNFELACCSLPEFQFHIIFPYLFAYWKKNLIRTKCDYF